MSEHLHDGTVRDREEVVLGKVMSQTGEIADQVLERIHKKSKEIQEKYLPKDIRFRAHIDRSNLIHITSHTVEENMTLGMILVVIVLLFFLGNLRSAMIVAITIP